MAATAAALPRAARAYEIAWADATIDWSEQIGSGSFGAVYPARVGDEELVAKVITLKGQEEIESLAVVLTEADTQHQIADDRVVRVRAVAVKDNGKAGAAQQKQVAIFLERMDRTLEEELAAIKEAQGGPGAPAAGDAAEWRRRLSLAAQVRCCAVTDPILSALRLLASNWLSLALPVAGCGRSGAAAPLPARARHRARGRQAR